MGFLPFRNLRERFGLRPEDVILDIGGSGGQITEVEVDTLIDVVPPSYYKDMYTKTLPPELLPDFELKAKKFIQLDVAHERFPVPDKTFDFCICTHTLEDLYDPKPVLAEIARVAKRGFIVTPSRGLEMMFTKFDLTDWLTGGARVPGHSHHHWFCEVKDQTLVITPKHYPLLYTPEFRVTKWHGPGECEYYWEGAPQVNFWSSVNFRELLADYRAFVAANRHLIRKGIVLIWLDNPFWLTRAYWRRLRHKGNAYTLK